MRDATNEIYLSPVSIWEIIGKNQLGKLPLPQSPEVYIPLQRQRHQVRNLPLDEDSVTKLSLLPTLHKDPFDRILICQAIQHGLVLASADKVIHEYSTYISLIT
jgi:PIN domain nuclease of toxin-antitoxin system